MPKYKLTNIKVKTGCSKLDAVKCLRTLGFQGSSPLILEQQREIEQKGYTTYSEPYVERFRNAFTFDVEVIKSEEEIAHEQYEAINNEAYKWYETLSNEEKDFVHIIGRGYIARA